MGNPQNYSLELPARCLALLDELWPYAQKTFHGGRPDLGPLTTTFLISMSMPIINVPIERIDRRRGEEDPHYASDRSIDPAVVRAIDETLGGKPVRGAPFFRYGAWRFVSCGTAPFPNIANGLPESIAEGLDADVAARDAANMPASRWCSILRNALAHGGIAYLNEQGQSSYGDPVKMFAFASGKYDQGRPQSLISVNFLRISENDYREFLHLWVGWLQKSGVAKASEAA